MRVSNFLLWQIAYAEIWITPVLWPDFRKKHLLRSPLRISDQGKEVRRRPGPLSRDGLRASRRHPPMELGKRTLTAFVLLAVVFAVIQYAPDIVFFLLLQVFVLARLGGVLCPGLPEEAQPPEGARGGPGGDLRGLFHRQGLPVRGRPVRRPAPDLLLLRHPRLDAGEAGGIPPVHRRHVLRGPLPELHLELHVHDPGRVRGFSSVLPLRRDLPRGHRRLLHRQALGGSTR